MHQYYDIQAWMSNYIRYTMWDEIIYPFPNFNGATVEVWKWISNFIPHFIGNCDYFTILVNWALVVGNHTPTWID